MCGLFVCFFGRGRVVFTAVLPVVVWRLLLIHSSSTHLALTRSTFSSKSVLCKSKLRWIWRRQRRINLIPLHLYIQAFKLV